MKSLYTETGLGPKKIHQNQKIVFLNKKNQHTKAILLYPSKKFSLARFQENYKLVERRISNLQILPMCEYL